MAEKTVQLTNDELRSIIGAYLSGLKEGECRAGAFVPVILNVRVIQQYLSEKHTIKASEKEVLIALQTLLMPEDTKFHFCMAKDGNVEIQKGLHGFT